MDDLLGGVNTMLETRMGKIGVGAAAVAGAVAASYYLFPGHKPANHGIDLQQQSIDIGGGVRANSLINETEDRQLLKTFSADRDTLANIFLSGLKISRHEKCLGTRCGSNREYKFQTYQQIYDRARAFASGLIKHGLKPNPNTFLGLYSKNRPEWVIAEQACNAYSMVTVALYDTLGPSACQYIINHMGITTVVCDTTEKAQALLDSSSHTPTLKSIIIMEDVTSDVKKHAQAHGISVLSFSDVEEMGKSNMQVPVPPKPEDLATVCFTSGTTGDPKGVMLTHANFAAQLVGCVYPQSKVRPFTSTDCHLSFLPLAHMYERCVNMFIFASGAHIGYISGDVTLLFDDMQALKPTILPTVPRLMNRVKDKIYASVKGSRLKSLLLDWAVSSKLADLKKGIIRKDTIWDRLVFRKIQAMHGGRVELMMTGSAPIPTETLEFFKCAMGCYLVEGYGQTEAVAGVTIQALGDTSSGNVGPPFMSNYIKLVDVPDMNYYAADNQGEICVWGYNVSPGYYKDPKKTAETFDKDGWLHTGDIGTWLPNGCLKVIDRKKHIFKLSQGEYVAPEKIESIYVTSQFAAQVFVDGDSHKMSCMGVVVPDAEFMELWAPNNGFPKDIEELCKNQEVKNIILTDLHNKGKQNDLHGFEQVKDIHLHPEAFSLENDLLTPTFKSKRPQLRQKFKITFAELYKKHNM